MVPKSAVTLVAVTVLACGGEGPDLTDVRGASVIVRDSAGVEIVEVPAVVLDALPDWRISADPILRLGQLEAPAEEVFGLVNHVARFPDGAVAVLDRTAMEIRMFGADGVFLTAFGRRGEGPGEFAGSRALDVIGGDTLGLWDSSLQRATFFTRDGSVVDEYSTSGCVSAHPSGICFYATGFLADGSLAIPDQTIISGVPEATGFGEVLPMGMGILSRDGSYRIVDSVPQNRMFYVLEEGRTRATFRGLFSGAPVAAASRTHLIVGHGDQRDLRFWTADGRLERIVRFDPPRPVVDSDLAVYEDVEWSEQRAPYAEVWLTESERSATWPTLSDSIIADTAGRLWVKEFEPWHTQPDSVLRSWVVFSPEGAPESRVRIPNANIQLQQIDEDAITWIETDSLGLTYAVVRGIER